MASCASAPKGANDQFPTNDGRYAQQTAPRGAVEPPDPIQSARSVLGTWSGNDGQQRIVAKFGANGSLLVTNAAGANSGRWAPAGGGRFSIQVGSFSGEFVLINAITSTLTIDGTTVEMSR